MSGTGLARCVLNKDVLLLQSNFIIILIVVLEWSWTSSRYVGHELVKLQVMMMRRRSRRRRIVVSGIYLLLFTGWACMDGTRNAVQGAVWELFECRTLVAAASYRASSTAQVGDNFRSKLQGQQFIM